MAKSYDNMADKNYSKRELDHYFKDLFKRMDGQDEVLKSINAQTTRTNGRVMTLEDKVSDYPVVKATVQTLTNYRWWFIGAIAVLTILSGFIAYEISTNIDYKISKGIDDAFTARFSNIQIIQK